MSKDCEDHVSIDLSDDTVSVDLSDSNDSDNQKIKTNSIPITSISIESLSKEFPLEDDGDDVESLCSCMSCRRLMAAIAILLVVLIIVVILRQLLTANN